jgi:hypothetical protein
MPGKLIPLRLPPGVFKNGTTYQAQGRWHTADLIRWPEKIMVPWGGWQKVQKTGSVDIDVSERITDIFAWRDNSGKPRLAYGTPTKFYTFIEGVENEATPLSGFTTGNADASTTTGNYGQGAYGTGNYGAGDPTLTTITEAQTWQIQAFGEDLVALAYSDGDILWWDTSAGGDLSIPAGAPTNNAGLVVTPERFLFALGAGGDVRTVAWPDRESLTDWTPSGSNEAGDFPLSTNGKLLTGRASKNETLLWTDVDLWAARYIGGTLVYSFTRIGDQCGAVSRKSMAMVDTNAFWMGHRGFFVYDGFVKGLESDVADYVFSDINSLQASKIVATTVAEMREVIWFYPSSGSNENDRYVSYNWENGTWSIGNLERTSGVDRGIYTYPMMSDAQGRIYDHERGTSRLDTDDSTELVPDAESGPVEIQNGDAVSEILNIIPDENTLGDVELSIFTSYFPTEDEVENGPYTAAKQTNVRLNARQVRLKLSEVNPNWRFGIPRLEIMPGGRR